MLPVMNHGFSNFAHRSLCDRQLSHKVVHTEFNFAHILRVSNSPWVSREGVCNQLLLPWFVADYRGELQKSDEQSLASNWCLVQCFLADQWDELLVVRPQFEL